MSEYANILNEYNERLSNVSNNLANTMNIANNLPQYLDTSDATATANDIVLGETAYVNGVKLTGTFNGVELNNQDKVISPSTSIQNIVADNGYTGLNQVTINAVTSSIDSDIQAGNIKSGVNILGIDGNLTPLEYNIKCQLPDEGWNGTKTDIPYNFKHGSVVSIDTDIYIFSGTEATRAYKYDTLTNAYTRLADVPYYFYNGGVVAVGTNIYLFGGGSGGDSNKAYKYDTINNTYTQLTNIPFKFVEGAIALVGTIVYLYGGLNFGYYKYDTTTDTYTSLTQPSYSTLYSSAVSIGTNIYLFGLGGVRSGNYAYKYNTLTNSYTLLTNLPYNFYAGSATVVGTDIYLFGGVEDGQNTYKYNTLTGTYTQLVNIPYSFSRRCGSIC